MEQEIITSTANPVIRQARALRERKFRQESSLFLVEGIHPVGSALEAGWKIDHILYAPEILSSEFGIKLVRQIEAQGVRCVTVSADLFSRMADKDNPQGILAIVQQKRFTFHDLDPTHIQLGVALVSPQDPGNVGSILRTMDSVGADALFILDGGVDLHHASVVRSSMGALFWIPAVQSTFDEFINWAIDLGFTIIGSSAHAKEDYRKFGKCTQRSILLLGNEQKGLQKDQMDACSKMVSIPMRGKSSSLNLSVAAGILLYQMMPG